MALKCIEGNVGQENSPTPIATLLECWTATYRSSRNNCAILNGNGIASLGLKRNCLFYRVGIYTI